MSSASPETLSGLVEKMRFVHLSQRGSKLFAGESFNDESGNVAACGALKVADQLVNSVVVPANRLRLEVAEEPLMFEANRVIVYDQIPSFTLIFAS